jgi:cell wall-associated NlpC family hydrolase
MPEPRISRLLAASLTASLTAMLVSGCATQQAGLSDVPGADRTASLSSDPPWDAPLPHDPLETIDTRSGMHTRSEEVVVQAVAQLGTPYRWGGESAENGFDCSGLAQHAFQAAGLALPRTARLQYRHTRRVDRDRIRPGDLVFFRLDGGQVDHVGIYIGGNRFIHAPSRGKTVSFARLDNAYWSRHFAGGGRLAESGELQLASKVSEDSK